MFTLQQNQFHSNHFCSRGGEGLKSVSGGGREKQGGIPITSKNSASGPELEFILYKKQVFDIINLDPCG